MMVRLSVEYEIDGTNKELEKLAKDLIRLEADRFADTLKRKLIEAGAEVKRFRAEYK